MKIQFGQADITAALKAHIVSQGISLDGKSVDITFTQTRSGKQGPMSFAANVSIEAGVQLPDLSDEAVVQRPALQVAVDNTPKAVVAAAPVAAAPAAAVKVDNAVATGGEGEQQQPVAEASVATGTSDAAPAAKTTTSLFN